MSSYQARMALAAQRIRREIVKARLTRREMVKFGLLTATGTLALKPGLSARADGGGDQPASPPTRKFVDPLPLPPAKQPVAPFVLDNVVSVNGDQGQTVPYQDETRFPGRFTPQ